MISLGTIIITVILSGNKTNALMLFAAYFIFGIYAVKWGELKPLNHLKKYAFLMLSVSLAIVFAITYLTTDNFFIAFVYRIAISGDTYFMSFPNHVIESIKGDPWYIALFASPLKMLHLISESQMPRSIGLELVKYHIDIGDDVFFGPNPRHNVFGYINFGNLAFVYSFIIGALFSFVRNKLFFKLPKNILGCIFYFLLYNSAVKIETDYYLALADFINVIILIVPVLVAIYIICKYFYVAKSFDNYHYSHL